MYISSYYRVNPTVSKFIELMKLTDHHLIGQIVKYVCESMKLHIADLGD